MKNFKFLKKSTKYVGVYKIWVYNPEISEPSSEHTQTNIKDKSNISIDLFRFSLCVSNLVLKTSGFVKPYIL
jgi:hypothetical protein